MQLALDPIEYFEFVRQNTFEVEFDGISPLAVQSAFMPNNNNDAVEVPIGNEKMYVAGKANFDTGDIVIRDTVDINTFQQVYNWRLQVYNATSGVIGRPSTYKKDGYIRMFAPDNTFIRQWMIKGVWPQAVNWGTLDQSSADVVQITMTMQYDKAFPA